MRLQIRPASLRYPIHRRDFLYDVEFGKLCINDRLLPFNAEHDDVDAEADSHECHAVARRNETGLRI